MKSLPPFPFTSSHHLPHSDLGRKQDQTPGGAQSWLLRRHHGVGLGKVGRRQGAGPICRRNGLSETAAGKCESVPGVRRTSHRLEPDPTCSRVGDQDGTDCARG